MDELVELRLRLLELSYKYEKPLPDVIRDFASIRITPVVPEKAEKQSKQKKTKK